MIRNDFVSNSSSSSFVVVYKDEDARKKFAEYCKNSGYGKISDIMYDHINTVYTQNEIEDILSEEFEECDYIQDDIKNNNDIGGVIFGRYTEDSSEVDDDTYADMKIYDLVKEYNNKDVKIVWEQGGW